MTMLVGCSGAAEHPTTEPTSPEKPQEQPSQAPSEATSTDADCPELRVGATIDGQVFADCVTEAIRATAGYAIRTTVLGIETTAAYNPSERAIATTTAAGSAIVIGDDVYVKPPLSPWQRADTESEDPLVVALSKGAMRGSLVDPAAAVKNITGTLHVTGTDSRLGEDVFVLTGTIQAQGAPVEVAYGITDDYAPLASTSVAEVNGQRAQTVTEVTEWDVHQDIVAPL
ncbi:hypothetical protein [Microbacterium suwonense]|nr:hypothetical protein [Microbacterium suwonense]